MRASVRSYRGMVTAPHHLAAQAGLDVLRDGGTAVEASVAVAATLAVVYPHMTGIGGDGFWLIAEPGGSVHAVHGCGSAAGRADLALYAGLAAVPTRGPLAANTVAGAVSAWGAALDRTDRCLSLDRLLRDAVHHAEAGVAVTSGGAAIAAAKGAELRNQPGGYAAIFEPAGRPLREGERLRQPALAATLRMLAANGTDDLYRGTLADLLAADLAAFGSPVSRSDLADHHATFPVPLHATITGATLYNSAAPTQGFASLLLLALFDRLQARATERSESNSPDPDDFNPGNFNYVHRLVEATKQAFLLRDRDVGDPAFHTVDLQAILDDGDQLDTMVDAIDSSRALPWPQPATAGDTCWFGVADRDGRMVSAIQSTYFEFGSGVVLPATGITWQNRGSSFRLAEQGWNALKPGRKPFHTLNPALARFDDGRLMAYGTMGGEGQPQTQAAIFTRYARGVGLQQAISAPRWLLGRTWGAESTTLKIEDGFAGEVYDALLAAGHDLERVGPQTAMMGHAGAIVRAADGLLDGATDPRSDGQVAAW